MIITDQAFLRADGRKGIRNHIVVAYLVECAHHVAREIVYPYRERGVHLIGFGGCYPNDYAARMMRTLCTHPNVGGVILLSLGCESFNRDCPARSHRRLRPARGNARHPAERRHAQNHRAGPAPDGRDARRPSRKRPARRCT